MKFTLRRIAPVQAGKIFAAFYGLMSLFVVPFMLLFAALGSFTARHQGGAVPPPFPLMFGLGIGFMMFLPVLYAVLGFVAGALGAAIYNLLARWLGGFELEFETAAGDPPKI